MSKDMLVSGRLLNVKKITSPGGFTFQLRTADGATFHVFAPLTENPFIEKMTTGRMSLKRTTAVYGVEWIATQVLLDAAPDDDTEAVEF